MMDEYEDTEKDLDDFVGEMDDPEDLVEYVDSTGV